MKIGLLDKATQRYFPIHANHVRIGSDETCHVVFDDASVARLHAEIHISDVGIELHHKGRSKATWVNDARVSRYFLSHHDRVSFGDLSLHFVISEEVPKGSDLCARCGVEISQFTTRRFTRGSPEGLVFCDPCEQRKSGKHFGLRQSTTSGGSSSSSRRLSSESELNDPYGLFRDLQRSGEASSDSFSDVPQLTPISVIAKGAQGVIHKMRYRDQVVAVKRLKVSAKSNAKERFQRETKALRALNHPSLVKLIDSIETEHSAYLIMEFIDGPSLESLIERYQQVPLKMVLKYACDVAAGIVYLSSQGIIHRDIKPSNVLIDQHETARLVDFGLVRFLVEHDYLTAPGQMVGSPSYMAPEQVRAQKVMPKSDIFALGVTFFEALTGQRPFPGNTPIELFTAILEDPPPLELVAPHGEEVSAVFEELLAKSLDDRPTPEQALAKLKEVRAIYG